jgi:hypothetical protein
MLTLPTNANPEQGFHNSAGLSITFEVIDVQTAKEYLSHNFIGNRTPSKAKIDEYSRLIKSGEWGLSDPITFDKNGDVIDGQHRLLSVIKAGIPTPFYVVRGVTPEAKEYINIGMTRSSTNIAEIRGIPNSNPQTLSIARRMTTPRFGQNVDNGLNKHEVVDVFMAFREGIVFANSVTSKGDAIRNGAISAVIARAYYQENHAELERFGSLLSGSMSCYKSENDTAPIKLREYYLKSNRRSFDVRHSLYFRAQSALSSFLKQKPVVLCKQIQGNLWPIPELDDSKKFAELRKLLKENPDYTYN